jgi:L,D-transpeptidase catalytic domain
LHSLFNGINTAPTKALLLYLFTKKLNVKMVKLVKKSVSVFAVIIALAIQFSFANGKKSENIGAEVNRPAVTVANSNLSLYNKLNLSVAGLSKEAFDYAMKGYQYLLAQGKIANDETLSIVDFSLPSSAKRLFVIDVKKAALLFNTYVSHGRNSGLATATEFSNEPNSFKSSLGFYITGNTYDGKHGYSLRLEGEEPNFNDNAASRGIVMHSAPYVNEALARGRGYIGRSEGCPAVPENLYKPIISKIKNGSCLFLYSPDQNYLSHSSILNAGV